jgi:hypothetical protein
VVASQPSSWRTRAGMSPAAEPCSGSRCCANHGSHGKRPPACADPGDCGSLRREDIGSGDGERVRVSALHPFRAAHGIAERFWL